MTKFRVGVDIGGTFTDIVFLGEDGRRLTKKVSSTVENYATAIRRRAGRADPGAPAR
jgi:N-methylhydantoinase A